ncbi:efflux RND transporter permease subunit [Cupriavidus basilensis]
MCRPNIRAPRPESVESDVTRKVEEIVNTISGIDEIFSHSYQGTSVVSSSSSTSASTRGQAAQDVRDKLALIRPQLRDEVKEPRVLRYDPTDAPIFYLSVSNAPGAQRSQRELTTIADQIVRKRLKPCAALAPSTSWAEPSARWRSASASAQLEALGIGVDQVMNAHPQREPGTASRRTALVLHGDRRADQGPRADARCVPPHHRRAARRPAC